MYHKLLGIKKTPLFLMEFFVGDIDLKSNQVLDFVMVVGSM